MHVPLPASLHHPGATCAACGRTGWRLDVRPVQPCACIGPCPACGDTGFLDGGATRCACALGRARLAALAATGLPAGLPTDPGAAGGWFSRYRPEDGWPWLLALGTPEAEVAGQLSALVLGADVPVRVLEPADIDGTLPFVRVLVVFGLERLSPARAERLTTHAVDAGLTLVATARSAPFEGLEADIGDAACLALIEHAEVHAA